MALLEKGSRGDARALPLRSASPVSASGIAGALGAVITFLLWLYISAYILLLGAELNQVLSGKGKPERA